MQKVKIQEYEEAVSQLIPLALTDSLAGRAAAQVLLGTFNGFKFKLDITDLCFLDRRNFDLAIAVIRGRVELGLEPHAVVDEGRENFYKIWDMWEKGGD